MNNRNESALNSEVELANAVNRIKESVADLDNLKKASATLEDVGKKNSELAEHLFRMSDSLRDAAQYLSREGIRKFGRTLEEQTKNIRGTLSNHQREISTLINEQFEEVQETIKGSEKSQNIKADSLVDELKNELNSKLKRLLIFVVVFGIGSFGLLSYMAFASGS